MNDEGTKQKDRSMSQESPNGFDARAAKGTCRDRTHHVGVARCHQSNWFVASPLQ